MAARKAHNLEVAGSNPAPATKLGGVLDVYRMCSTAPCSAAVIFPVVVPSLSLPISLVQSGPYTARSSMSVTGFPSLNFWSVC